MVIRVVEKRQFWVVIRMVRRGGCLGGYRVVKYW